MSFTCMNQITHMWMSHGIYMNSSCHTWIGGQQKSNTDCTILSLSSRAHTYECVMSHVWTSHVAVNSNTKCTTLSLSSHVTRMNVSSHTCECVMLHVTHANVSCCSQQQHALPSHHTPQTEEIGLKIITTAKISNEFSRESPYISNTF